MTAQEILLQKDGGNSLVSNRLLGTIGMFFSPMLFFGLTFFFPQEGQTNPHPLLAGLCGVLYLTGAMTSAKAVRNLRVTGSGTGALILYIVQMSGLFLAMWCDVLENAAPQLRDTTIYFITDMAYPFSHLLMLVVGVAIIRAKVWRGWRRIPSFLVGLALPVTIGLSAIVGRETGGFIFLLMVTSGFFLLGFAVSTTEKRETNLS